MNTCRLDTTVTQPDVAVMHKDDSTRVKFSEWMVSTFWGTTSLLLSSQQFQSYKAEPIFWENGRQIKGRGKKIIKKKNNHRT